MDEDCCCCNPASGTIAVTVMDKNYDNIDEIAGQQRVSEALPFASYLSGVTLWRHAEGADTSELFVPEFLPEDADVVIDTACLLPGTNELIVVGNELLPTQRYDGPVFTRELHPDGDEYVDLYIGTEDIVSPVHGDHAIRMYRTKGKLLVLPEGIPSDVVGIEVEIGNVYGSVGRNLAYSDSTGVVKRFALSQAGGADELSLFAAPGRTSDGQSPVTVRFAKQDGGTVALSNIFTSIHRNEISVIKPSYDPDSGEWSLEVFVDGRWARVENLRIS